MAQGPESFHPAPTRFWKPEVRRVQLRMKMNVCFVSARGGAGGRVCVYTPDPLKRKKNPETLKTREALSPKP